MPEGRGPLGERGTLRVEQLERRVGLLDASQQLDLVHERGRVRDVELARLRVGGPRLVAALTRLLRDIGLAEEVAQDAFVAALEQWPRDGVPASPWGWLITVASCRLVDVARSEAARRRRESRGGHRRTDYPPASLKREAV